MTTEEMQELVETGIKSSVENVCGMMLGCAVEAWNEQGQPVIGEVGVSSLDGLWQLLVRAAVLWYALFAVWTLLI